MTRHCKFTVFAAMVCGCTPRHQSPPADVQPTPIPQQDAHRGSLEASTRAVVAALDAGDLEALARLVDPVAALRIGLEGEALEPALHFSRADITGARTRAPVIPYDAGDREDRMSFQDYVATHLRGFETAPLVGYDRLVHTDPLASPTHELDAIRRSFGNAPFTQLAWPTDSPGNPGEWRSLVLVFRRDENHLWLLGTLPNKWAP